MPRKSAKRGSGSGSRKSTAPSERRKKPPEDEDRIDRIFEEGVEIDRALDRAVSEALRMHKRAGNPVPIWKNGKVVWIPASKIRP